MIVCVSEYAHLLLVGLILFMRTVSGEYSAGRHNMMNEFRKLPTTQDTNVAQRQSLDIKNYTSIKWDCI